MFIAPRLKRTPSRRTSRLITNFKSFPPQMAFPAEMALPSAEVFPENMSRAFGLAFPADWKGRWQCLRLQTWCRTGRGSRLHLSRDDRYFVRRALRPTRAAAAKRPPVGARGPVRSSACRAHRPDAVVRATVSSCGARPSVPPSSVRVGGVTNNHGRGGPIRKPCPSGLISAPCAAVRSRRRSPAETHHCGRIPLDRADSGDRIHAVLLPLARNFTDPALVPDASATDEE